jgi:PAS domain S-box-containing protein
MTLAGKTYAGLISAFIVVLLSGVACFYSLTRLTQEDESVRQTDRGLEQLGTVLELLVEQQNGLRGFVLTGRDDFLLPYERARTELPGELAVLRMLLGNDPSQRDRLDELDHVAAERLAWSEEEIDLRRTQGMQGAIAHVAIGRGDAIIRHARSLITTMQNDTRHLLRARTAADRDAARVAFSLAVLASMGILIVVVLSTSLLRRVLSAEKALRSNNDFLESLLEASPIGLLLIRDPEGEHVEMNRAAQDMVGRRLERVAQYEELLFTPEGAEVSPDRFPSTRALKGERFAWTEYLVHGKKGMVPVVGSAAPVLDRHGNLQGAVVAFQDITPVKDLERLRAEWNSVVAHDLRQPLYVIDLTAQALASRSPTTELRPALERIRDAVARLERMIQDLLDLSRLDARQLALSRVAVDVRHLVQAGVDRAAMGVSSRHFEVRASSELPEVDADPDRVAQVLDNLLTNALKYSDPGTPVVVEISPERDDVSVAVTNQGQGIAPLELPFLFRRFHRTDEARRSGVKGIGLGLYITRELVEAQGGHISVESTPGSTTTFRFTLPVHRAA